MKFFITIIATFAFASASDETGWLFHHSHEHQNTAADLQSSVTRYAIDVRTAVPRVLGVRANLTINKIEINVDQLLDQEADARTAIFALSSSNCVHNLRVLLNGITEFTGFESSNCVSYYDTELSGLIQRYYGQVANYEKTFGDVLRVVPRSFAGGRNMFTEHGDIVNNFVSQLTALQANWEAQSKNIDEFEANFGEDIDRLNTNLQGCFNGIQVAVNPSYAVLTNEIATCGRFDNSRDPFEIFQ